MCASDARLWPATSSLVAEQSCTHSGPPEIALTICLSYGTEGCWKKDRVCVCVCVWGCFCVCFFFSLSL